MTNHVRVYLCGAAVLGAMVWAAGASADRPIKEPGEPETTFFFPANTICAFPITVQTESRGFTITHLDTVGNPIWIGVAGSTVQQVTNDLTGESVVLNVSGPGKVIPTDEGLTLLAHGPWIFGFFPTDSPPTSLLLLTGRTVAHIDPASGQQTLISHQGTVRDLCAELA